MKLDLVDPELRRSVARMPRLPVRRKWGRRVVRALVRRRGLGEPVEGVDVRDIDQGHGIRVYTPAGGGSEAALLWVHGGGYVIGDVVQDDAFCSATAHELGIVVVSTNYRLAPERPFPAALDDTLAAWQWLQESAGHLGVDQERIVVGGSSAGAGLAACLVQRLHDAGGVQPVGQWLFSPMLDDRTAARRELDQVQHRMWNNAANRTGWGAYLGAGRGGPRTPDYAVAARRTDLRGLPPAWISVGDIDLFTDECRAYAERLRDAGVDCTFDLVPGAPHGFEAWAHDTRLARELLERSRTWLGARLTGSAPAPQLTETT
ncbi:alpha/beta hydrolase [Streptomyces sp. NBC_01613]|uniref:alpha/beta hydrolase n=1 Tax=Streptomyces sp. NBC_01613 TaxID=2975896 RepID=UPI0038666D0C